MEGIHKLLKQNQILPFFSKCGTIFKDMFFNRSQRPIHCCWRCWFLFLGVFSWFVVFSWAWRKYWKWMSDMYVFWKCCKERETNVGFLVTAYVVSLFTFSLINKLKPGVIKKINRLSTPIAGLVSNKFSSKLDLSL